MLLKETFRVHYIDHDYKVGEKVCFPSNFFPSIKRLKFCVFWFSLENKKTYDGLTTANNFLGDRGGEVGVQVVPDLHLQKPDQMARYDPKRG